MIDQVVSKVDKEFQKQQGVIRSLNQKISELNQENMQQKQEI